MQRLHARHRAAALKSWSVAPFSDTDMRRTILLVDDEPSFRRLIVRLLAAEGHAAIPCESVREAIAVIESETPFDLVLTDMVLPDGGGTELAPLVARARPGVRVVFMSGRALEQMHPDARPPRSAAFLHKPFRREDLFVEIGVRRLAS